MEKTVSALKMSGKTLYCSRVAFLCGLYVFVGSWGLRFNAVNGFAAPVWAPTGISLAALLLFGYDLWPGILLGAFLVNAVYGASPTLALAFAAGNTLEALIGFSLLHLIRFRNSFDRLRDVLGLFVLAAVVSTWVSATFGVLALCFHGVIPLTSYGTTFKVWWLGDMLSDMVIAPFLLVWLGNPPSLPSGLARWTEAALLTVSLLVVNGLVFAHSSHVAHPFLRLPYLIFPFLLWDSMRFGPWGAAAATLLTALFAIANTVRGLGPLTGGSLHEGLMHLHVFMGVMSMMAFTIAAIAAEELKSQESTLKSEQRFKTLVENSPGGVVLLNPEGRVRFIAPNRKRILGYLDEEITDRPVFDLLHPDDRPLAQRTLNELLQDSSKSVSLQVRARHADGLWRWLEATCSNCMDNPSTQAVVINFQDITLTKAAEVALRKSHEEMENRVIERTQDLFRMNAQLRESEELFRTLVEGVEDYAIFGLDPAGHITTWNSGAERLKGYRTEEILGQHFSRFYTPEDIQAGKPAELLRRAMAKGRVRDEGWRIHKDGSRYFCDVVITALRDKTGALNGFTTITRDITQQKTIERTLQQKEAELSQAQKLEAIGRLAGGVAHDFNNLITGILGISQELKGTFRPEDPRRAEIEELIKASNRAFDVTRQLLAFGRRQIASPKVIDINATISDFGKMLHRLIGEDIKLELRLSDQSHIRMDPGHMGQVLMNLTLNARDAMPDGGVILIQTTNIDHPQQNGQPAPYVLLEVTDTGKGMDPETLTHLFEPFFTTKTKDQGTGLGLATVYGIVKQNGGDISVHSQLGNGTTFRIYLPREIHAPETEEEPPLPAQRREGHETILVVEDEDVVRRVVVKRLSGAGYTVLEASDPQKALQLNQELGSTIDLVVTDVVMPGMNGRELISRIQALRPDIAVLYMSAYPESIIAHRGILDPGIHFIEKSAIHRDLVRKVGELLGTPVVVK